MNIDFGDDLSDSEVRAQLKLYRLALGVLAANMAVEHDEACGCGAQPIEVGKMAFQLALLRANEYLQEDEQWN